MLRVRLQVVLKMSENFQRYGDQTEIEAEYNGEFVYDDREIGTEIEEF